MLHIKAMKKRIVLILFCFLLVQAAHAGWEEQTSGTTEAINSIHFLTSTVGYAAGANGTVIRTTNGGLSWTTLSSNTIETINDVIFPAASEGYFVGTNGLVLKTTDAGGSFNQVAGLPSANYKKAAYSGSDRILAGSMGDTAAGYLVTNWAAATVTDFAIDGVYLTSGATWMWGKYITAGENSIVKRTATTDEVVWQDTTDSVSDIAFASSTVAYAVGPGGLILKSTDGGNDWSELTSGTTEDLNTLAFADENIGWVVGENGTVLYTVDGGTNFSPYTLSDPTTDIKDIMIKVVGNYVDAWICGSGGKIYKLSSPTITGITPTSAKQGKIGTLEVIGTGFSTGAAVSFSSDEIAVSSTTFYSATRLVADYIVSPEATLGAYDVTVTNPDATTSEEANAFTVNANAAQVTFNNKRFDNNVSYLPPESTSPDKPRTYITHQPLVSFEVTSTANNGVSPQTLNARIFINYTDANNNEIYIFAEVPTSEMTQLPSGAIQVSYTVPVSFPTGEVVTFSLYAEDVDANVGQDNMLVAIAQPLEEGPPDWGPPSVPGASKPGRGWVGTPTSTSDPLKDGVTVVYTPLYGSEVDEGFSIYCGNGYGERLFKIDFNSSGQVLSASGNATVVKKQAVTAKGLVTQFKFHIPKEDLPPHMTSGMYMIRVVDNKGRTKAANPAMFTESASFHKP
jgi:photosystem II stability/assembly factor-like uncharacterized protein